MPRDPRDRETKDRSGASDGARRAAQPCSALRAGLKHDVGGQLQSILSCSTLLHRGKLTEEQRSFALGAIRASTQRIARRIDDWVDWIALAYQPDAFEATPQDLGAALAEASAQSDGLPALDLGAVPLPAVMAQGRLLVSLFRQLLTLAAEHESPPARVAVSADLDRGWVGLRFEGLACCLASNHQGEGVHVCLKLAERIVAIIGARMETDADQPQVLRLSLPAVDGAGDPP